MQVTHVHCSPRRMGRSKNMEDDESTGRPRSHRTDKIAESGAFK
jgi:hypothetical protein